MQKQKLYFFTKQAQYRGKIKTEEILQTLQKDNRTQRSGEIEINRRLSVSAVKKSKNVVVRCASCRRRKTAKETVFGKLNVALELGT